MKIYTRREIKAEQIIEEGIHIAENKYHRI